MNKNRKLLIIQDYQIVEVVEVLLQFSSSIKVIVLCMNKESCDIFRYMLVYLLFYNVVYLDELNNTDVSTSSNDLFKNAFRQNFKGKSILYSSREMIQKEHVLIQWIENAASRLNTTAQRSIHSCSFEKNRFIGLVLPLTY